MCYHDGHIVAVQHMATYNMEQPIRERVTNYTKSLFVVFHS